MASKNVLILDKAESPWFEFLKEFFEDTRVSLHCFHEACEANAHFAESKAQTLFVHPDLLHLPLIQKIKVAQQSQTDCLLFGLSTGESSDLKPPWIKRFAKTPEDMVDFTKELMGCILLPESVKVLVVDDEMEIGKLVCDYLEGRAQPSFQVRHARNGQEGFDAIREDAPDVLILDIKMPVKDGRDLYRELVENGIRIPTIVFFDSISFDEVAEIRSLGKVAVLEKGTQESSMAGMLALIKKKIYFG